MKSAISTYEFTVNVNVERKDADMVAQFQAYCGLDDLFEGFDNAQSIILQIDYVASREDFNKATMIFLNRILTDEEMKIESFQLMRNKQFADCLIEICDDSTSMRYFRIGNKDNLDVKPIHHICMYTKD